MMFLVSFLKSNQSYHVNCTFIRVNCTFIAGRKGSIAVIITPLIALMIDQKRSFQHKGITVEFVGEAQHDRTAATSVLKGEIQLVYISPECILNNNTFRNMLQKSVYQERLVALVVDEAHCIQMWLVKYIFCV